MTYKTFFSPWVMAALVAVLCVCLPHKPAENAELWPELANASIARDRQLAAVHNQFAQFHSVDHREIQCMADAIYNEAGFEPDLGKAAVARVIVNRTKSEQFPKSVCGVIHEKHEGVCQFSYVCMGGIKHRDPTAFRVSYQIAVEVLTKDQYRNLVPNALFYHADYVNPGWRLPRVRQIGRHIFYNPRDLST